MYRHRKKDLAHFFVLTVILFAIWILLSGKVELKFLLIGLISSLIISFISLPFMTIKDLESGKEYFVFGVNYLKLIPYCLWVIKEIFKSTIDVSHEILKKHVDYEPRIVYFRMPLQNPMARVVLANSIILTPGTITVDVMSDGIFEVHALNKNAADDMLTGEMPRRVAALFGETCEFTPMPEMEITDIPKEVGE